MKATKTKSADTTVSIICVHKHFNSLTKEQVCVAATVCLMMRRQVWLTLICGMHIQKWLSFTAAAHDSYRAAFCSQLSSSFRQADVQRLFRSQVAASWVRLTSADHLLGRADADEIISYMLSVSHIFWLWEKKPRCVCTEALWKSDQYLWGLRDLSHFLALALLRHALSILGPVDAPAHRQHALQGLSNWPSVNLFLLPHGDQSSRSV